MHDKTIVQSISPVADALEFMNTVKGSKVVTIASHRAGYPTCTA